MLSLPSKNDSLFIYSYAKIVSYSSCQLSVFLEKITVHYTTRLVTLGNTWSNSKIFCPFQTLPSAIEHENSRIGNSIGTGLGRALVFKVGLSPWQLDVLPNWVIQSDLIQAREANKVHHGRTRRNQTGRWHRPLRVEMLPGKENPWRVRWW